MQNDYFTNGNMPVVDPEIASSNVKEILVYFRNMELVIVHVQHISTREGSSFFIPNTEGVKIHNNVKPYKDEKIITKHYPNSFYDTELLDYLKYKKITDIVICGMMTHMCIDSTTRAAKDFGYNIELIGDACATKDLEINGVTVKAQEVQRSFLASLNYFYSEVVLTKDFLNRQGL